MIHPKPPQPRGYKKSGYEVPRSPKSGGPKKAQPRGPKKHDGEIPTRLRGPKIPSGPFIRNPKSDGKIPKPFSPTGPSKSDGKMPRPFTTRPERILPRLNLERLQGKTIPRLRPKKSGPDKRVKAKK